MLFCLLGGDLGVIVSPICVFEASLLIGKVKPFNYSIINIKYERFTLRG
jgi:hypothetical protein